MLVPGTKRGRLTSYVVAENAGGDDPAVRTEEVLEILLRHVLG